MLNINSLNQEGSKFDDNDLVCYCFQYTKKNIEDDYFKNGRSMILEKIIAEKKIGGCDCAEKNPKGRWCLADVHQLVEKIKSDGQL